jgi:hypothetical protein
MSPVQSVTLVPGLYPLEPLTLTLSRGEREPRSEAVLQKVAARFRSLAAPTGSSAASR